LTESGIGTVLFMSYSGVRCKCLQTVSVGTTLNPDISEIIYSWNSLEHMCCPEMQPSFAAKNDIFQFLETLIRPLGVTNPCLLLIIFSTRVIRYCQCFQLWLQKSYLDSSIVFSSY
jgi:hypothetical protein